MSKRKAKSKDMWRLDSKTVRKEEKYVFDTVEDSPFLCTVIVINGVVSSYSGVFALDAEIVRKLEDDGVTVPANCRE